MTDDKTLPVDESCARSYLTTAVHDLAAMDTVAFELARNKEAERLGITSDELKRAVVAARKTIQADSEPTTSESSPGISPTELEAEVRKLAELDPVKFELSRESEAQRLGVSGPELSRAVTAARRQIDKSSDTKQKPVLFEETVTWDGPIDAGSLFDEMLALVQRFAICEQPYAVTAVLWCAMTWFMQHLRVAPFAMITAPTLACGKSVMLEIMSLMSRRAFMASSTSEAVLFRLIDRDQISLFLDESDRAISPQRQELIGVLNASYTQRFAVTSRCVGDDHEPRTFSTWGPKAFAGIGGLEDTLRSRSVPLSCAGS